MPSTVTVGDRIKVDVRIGNLNSYALNVRIASENVTRGPITFSLPTGTFTVRARSSITRSITLIAQNITSEPTYVTLAISALANLVKFGDSLTVPVKVLPRGFPRQ